tara:strand:+ start:85 stop:270 length:186 start_codon:yes stop_codon:yes gene_type:complete
MALTTLKEYEEKHKGKPSFNQSTWNVIRKREESERERLKRKAPEKTEEEIKREEQLNKFKR